MSYGWGEQNFMYEIQGDSILNFVPYKILWTVNDGLYYYSGLLREDITAQKVYYNYGGTEYMLYDFSLEVGDEASVYGIGLLHDIVVTEVTTTMVGGDERKKIIFDEPEGWGLGYWIEGVGSEFGLPDAALGMVTDYDPNLTCFYIGNELAWDNPDITNPECGALLNSEELENAQLSIYPNPANTEVKIRVSQALLGKLIQATIYNSTGELVQRVTTTERTLDISKMAAGIYLLQVQSEDRFLENVRLVVR